MLPPAMTMDRGMGAGNDEARQRLHEFRQHHKGMGWFYRLLDVPYGIEMATSDVARFSTPAAITAALIFDSLIALIFGLIWWRYDLMSTWTTLDPLATGLTTAANTLLTGLKLPPQVGAVVGWVVATLIRVAVTLGPSIIQFRMPYDASRHDAAWLALWGTAIFDMGTDSVDIRTDVPTFFGWLQGAATNADSAVWVSLIALGLVLVVIRNRQWPLWAGLIAVSVACLGWGQAGNVVFWANVGFWTIFASFAAQSLFFIYAAKVMMLVWKRQALARVAA
jgi:hypothetical protein